MASKSPPLLLAAGILSAPEYTIRRQMLRATWLSVASSPILFRFVIRMGGLPTLAPLSLSLSREQRVYGDVVGVRSVKWNETRQRGPILSLVAWLRHAARRLPHARFIAKLDDDVYLHSPSVRQLLDVVGTTRGVNVDRVYMGFLTWFHYMPDIFAHSVWGVSWSWAFKLGARHRNDTRWQRILGAGPSVGPFPFASGFLIVLGSQLSREISKSSIVTADVRRLRATSSFREVTGEPTDVVLEDVWLGSVLQRIASSEAGFSAAVHYMQLRLDKPPRSGKRRPPFLRPIIDGAAVRVTPVTYLYHLYNKSLPHAILTHDYVSSSAFCGFASFAATCRVGCHAFGVDADRLLSEDRIDGLRATAFCARRDSSWCLVQPILNTSCCTGESGAGSSTTRQSCLAVTELSNRTSESWVVAQKMAIIAAAGGKNDTADSLQPRPIERERQLRSRRRWRGRWW